MSRAKKVEEMEKLEQAGKEQRRAAQGDLSAKLARLKAESAPAGATPKKRRRAPSSANPAGEAGAKKRKPAPRGKRQEQAEEAPRSKKAKVTVDSTLKGQDRKGLTLGWACRGKSAAIW